MPEKFVHKRITDGRHTKGQVQLQSYSADTERTVTSTPSGYTDVNSLISDQTTTTTTALGDRRETRTTTGLGKTVTAKEDKGAVLKFQIRIQNRQPITRS